MTSSRKFAHYEVSEKIGAGGMGEVFRATDSNLGREAALKMLPDTVAADPERLARFKREAQVLAALNHPGIASVYGLESQENHYALAMELVPGPELAERLQTGPIQVEEGLQIALQLAEAIEAAHEKGIVHRDLKPANIKLTGEGRVKVLDFGLAKALADDPAGSGSSIDMAMSPTLTANMTMGNVILGTAAYMSPEQARGTDVDKRADIWAFGVVVTEMLGGQRLFGGETVSDTLASVLQARIDLDALPDDLHPAVMRLLQRCLQRDPRQRLRDIGDARIILQEVISGNAEELPDAPVTKPNPWPLRIAAIVAVVAIAAAIVAFMMPGPEEVALPLRKFEIPMTAEDPSAMVYFSPTLSPDGRFLAYVSQEQIWVRDLATTISRPLPGTEGARDPFWSPDGEWIAFGTARTMQKIDRSGGHVMILANVAGNMAISSAGGGIWNADGTLFYTTGNTGVLRLSAQAGEVTRHHATAEGEVDFHELGALPDGRGWILVVHDKNSYGQLSLLTPEGKRKPIFSYEDDSFKNPVWSPSGHILFERAKVAEGIWALPYSLESLEATGAPFLIATDGRCPTVGRDGTLVYTSGRTGGQQHLAWFDRQGNELEIIAEVDTRRPFPSLTPDDEKILIASNADGNREIFLFDTTNGNEQRLTYDTEVWDMAAWLPSGKQFVAYTEPDYAGKLITVDGSEPVKDLGPGILGHISADGATYFYGKPQLEDSFDFDIAARAIDAPIGDEKLLVSTTAVEWYPSPSPDGKYLLYTSDETGQQEVYATTYPGLVGRWQISKGGGSWGIWRGDSKEIFYTDHDAIYSVSVSDENGIVFGRPVKLFDRPNIDWSPTWPDGFDVTADGQRFVMVRAEVDENAEAPRLVVVQNWYAEFEQESNE